MAPQPSRDPLGFNAMRRAPAVLATTMSMLLAIALIGCPKKLPPPPAPTPAPAPPLPPIVDPSACGRAVRIVVSKADRQLTIDCSAGGRVVFPIALARDRGPKRAQGDHRMPEGDYAIAGPARESRFHLFLPIDYPGRADAERALAERRIDRAAYDAIARAHAQRRMPPQDTALGGALGFHGEGARWRGDLDLNWTEGCVALTDRAVEQLARLVRRGTPVRIDP
jgi:L,D-transpeptidase catalytic domain